MSDAYIWGEMSFAQEVEARNGQQVSIAYSGTETVSREAYVYQGSDGWHLVDNEACAAFDLPRDWLPITLYGWSEDDDKPCSPWDRDEHKNWLVVLPAHK